MRREPALVACFVLSAVALSSSALADSADRPQVNDSSAVADRVVIRGVGSAHGLGMAMDGVVGEANAGWTHDQILNTFYPGTTTRNAGGTIRVGLADGGVQRFTLAQGGTITDALGGAPGPGFPISVTPGARITVLSSSGHPTVRVDAPAPRPTASAPPLVRTQTPNPAGPLPTAAPPSGAPTAPPPPLLTPSPTATAPTEPTPPLGEPAGEGVTSPNHSSVWISPRGDPAVTGVDATGKRYRGLMEVRAVGGSLRVVNHVDLETYVRGIAEARGAGWPNEAMKALAVASRSLGAATMSWFGRNRAEGYDICPTDSCQVYFGYDGEDAAMTRAATQTAGQIRVYNGRPILAMYHGNGGGQTEDYGKLARTKVNGFPYLRSVRYPYASPSTWRRDTTYGQIAAALGVSGPIERIEILERGESPRVIRMRVVGAGGEREMTGTKFMTALHLRSTWFFIGERRTSAVLSAPIYPHASVPSYEGGRSPAENPWPAVTGAAALFALAAAAVSKARKLPGFLQLAPRQRVALTPSPPGS